MPDTITLYNVGCALAILAATILVMAFAVQRRPTQMSADAPAFAVRRRRHWWGGRYVELTTAPPAKPVRRYTRGDCPHCGRPDTVLRADGEPHCQYHDCPVLAERLDRARAKGWPPTPPQAPRTPVDDIVATEAGP